MLILDDMPPVDRICKMTVGTTGQNRRMEALRVTLSGIEGGIEYCAHAKNLGWGGWVRDGEVAGTTGESRRVEAVRIKLYGDAQESYDVWYCAHAKNLGWMGWASNGDVAGTVGESRRIEAIQVVLVPKGEPAPPADVMGASTNYPAPSRP